ncbi:hypothetical protein Tco_0375242 [Tanacetum coccineum]
MPLANGKTAPEADLIITSENSVFENHYSGVASGSSVPSIHKPRGKRSTEILRKELETDLMNNGINVSQANGRTGLEAGLIVTSRILVQQEETFSSSDEAGVAFLSGRGVPCRKDTKEEDTRSSYTMWCLLANEYENDVIYLGRYCTCAIFFYMKKFHIIELEMYYNTSGIINYGYFIQEVESIKKISENVAWLSGVSKGHGEWQFNQMLFKDLIDGDGICGLRKCHMILVARTFKSFSKDEVFMYLGENLKLTPQKDVEPEPNLPLQKIIILDPDDHPMWESAKTIAQTPSSAIVKVNVDDNFVINSTYLKYRFG